MPKHNIYCQKCGDFKHDVMLKKKHLHNDNAEELLCHCGLTMKVYVEKPHVHHVPVKVDIQIVCKHFENYESPTSGEIVNGFKARKEDMARTGCVEYDPEMKTDYKNRIAREEKELSEKVEETVNKEIARMPARKRGQLFNELANGADIVTERLTVNG